MELSYLSLPEKCGVYLFKDRKGQVIYVGKALNLKSRVRSYFASPIKLGVKTASLISRVAKVETICVESEIEAYLLESRLIKKYQPKHNVKLKDGKTYPQIKISDEEIPRVSFARKKKDQAADYFGPFPDVKTMRFVLKLARRMFPFRTCRSLPVKPCLYFHLDLCPAPCIKACGLPEYRESIDNLKMFLKGKKREVIRRLTQKMNQAAKDLDFEKAQKIRNQIERIEYITQPVRVPRDYIEKPDLLEDQRREELAELFRVLNFEFRIPCFEQVFWRKANFEFCRIEAFDVSNISGKLATGSMVVFVDGEPEKSSYRKFKIKNGGKADDIAMMGEILRRRFRHQEWPKPDLIVVDGGAGQLNVALKVLKDANLRIPTIGLAKREEEIFLGAENRRIRLPKDSPALHLILRIRDEAHRFAIFYHRKLARQIVLTPAS